MLGLCSNFHPEKAVENRTGLAQPEIHCQRQELQQELCRYSRNISASAAAPWCRGLLAVLITWFYYLIPQEALQKLKGCIGHCQAHGGPARIWVLPGHGPAGTPSLQGPPWFDPEDIPGAEERLCTPNLVPMAGCSTSPFVSPPQQPGLAAALGFRHE